MVNIPQPEGYEPATRMHGAAAALNLQPDVLATMRESLPSLASATVTAIIDGVPSYRETLTGLMGENIESAVELALVNFLRLAAQLGSADPASPIVQSTRAAYDLGRGEARSGRTMEALLAAYRIGARSCWQGLSRVAVDAGVSAGDIGIFAELVFAYIDALSAASVSGHADELHTSGRVLRHYREMLAVKLLTGEPDEVLQRAAERASWTAPTRAVAAIVAANLVQDVLPSLPEATLVAPGDLVGLTDKDAALVIPLESARDRRITMGRLATHSIFVGPEREWSRVASSFGWCTTAVEGTLWDGRSFATADEMLPELMVSASPDAHRDLVSSVLAPLADMTDAQREKLTATLRAYILHRGVREAVAKELFIHGQTVRYRIQQLREAFGDRLDDPRFALEALFALGPQLPQATDSE